MRVGALVVPDKLLLEKAAGIKSTYNMQASAMNQALTECFLTKNSYLADNLAKLRQTYKHRCQLMTAALAKHFPKGSGYTWNSPSGGMFLWLTGPKDVNFHTLLDEALERGVAYMPGDMFFAEPGHATNCARLNFASLGDDKVDEAIRRLAQTATHSS
jgi:2-aminoadipate transaminase